MTNTEELDLVETLSQSRFYFQKELCDSPEVLVSAFFQVIFPGHLCRKDFKELHFGYEPVPEVYLRSEVFDKFFRPREHLDELRNELGEDVEIALFIEALGCYVELDEKQRADLNSNLRVAVVPQPRLLQRNGLVLMCWDRIDAAANRLGANDLVGFISVVAFHEHSHAARAATLLRRSRHEVLQAEETVAQWESYMFLRSRDEDGALDGMKKLMGEQPLVGPAEAMPGRRGDVAGLP